MDYLSHILTAPARAMAVYGYFGPTSVDKGKQKAPKRTSTCNYGILDGLNFPKHWCYWYFERN